MKPIQRRTPRKAQAALYTFLRPSEAPLLAELNVCPVALPWMPDLSLLQVEPRIGGWGVRDYRPAYWGQWVRDDMSRELFETREKADQFLAQIRKTADLWTGSHFKRAVRI